MLYKSIKKRKNFILMLLLLVLIKNLIDFYLIIDEEDDLNYDEYPNTTVKINACIIALVRNEDLHRFIKTIKKFERNFNRRYKYPYVLFSENQFSKEFVDEFNKHTKAVVEFAKIDDDHWRLPNWIDKTGLENSIKKLGFSENYRHMCRFFSGFFYKQNATLKYEYYWRIDLDSEFPCQIKKDPFEIFIKNKQLLYGFAVGSKEARWTMPTLWETIKKWHQKTSIQIKPNKITNFFSEDSGESLTNLCIFYNNFEIAKFSLFRNDLYESYFDALDSNGGFYYERWGDAPVHTYFIALTLNKTQVYLFTDVPYGHQKEYNYHILFRTCYAYLNGCAYEWKHL